MDFVTCVKKVPEWGYDTYVNICTNTRVDVMWGTGDWIAVWVLGGCLAALGLVLIGVLFIGVREMFDLY